MPSYEKELNAVVGLIKEAGAEIMELYGGDYPIKIKEDDSPVTKADLVSEEILINGLKGFGYGFVAEESGVLESDSGMYWVIDPLDGTKDFIQGIDEFSIMVGLLKGSRPVLGVVFAPAIEKMWYAVEGCGAFQASGGSVEEISVSAVHELRDYRMLISRNHFRKQDKDVATRLGITQFKEMGSAGVKFCTIAEGDAELCIYTTGYLGLWDCCAPHVILREAGGTVFNAYGGEPVYNMESRKMASGFIGGIGGYKDEILESVKAGSLNKGGDFK